MAHRSEAARHLHVVDPSTSAEEGAPEVLTTDEVAALLRVNRKTIYEAVQAGRMPGVIRVWRVLRFLRRDVLKSASQGRLIPEKTGKKR